MKLLSSFCDLERNPVKRDNFPEGTELINFQVRINLRQSDSKAYIHVVEGSFINYC